ncbi:sulfatase-like hydrolase/transferase [Cerasicoccus fimbriatus]|uniref:sulfatase-like hydrolase/transferase n=1 Tax=Cerasicoccus fimbriatus TaxID=3014554 RepID=UPI0022B4F829|nr:sulfatase-like hydrolase/transferase [Cerasicoccus sp. TK19100]
MSRFFLLAIISLCVATVGRAEVDARPNILIILADDLGYEALGCYGGLTYETPELDTMAADGLRFAYAYTSPVCTPTRVSMHTSLYTFEHGHTGVLPVHNGTSEFVDFNAMPTFAQLLQADGYQTSTTGKWQLATLTEHPNHIANAGFDSWCVWQIWDGSAKTERFWDPYLNRDGVVMTGIEDRFGPDVLVDYVKVRMATATADGEPFMIVHNEMLPHSPLVNTPAGGGASLANMVNYMDFLVGELLDEVEALGIRENTYVIFIGDNGTDTGAVRETTDGEVTDGKRDLSDGGTHVPFIVWGPSSVPVGVSNDLIDITDVFPTVCSLAGVAIPETIEYRGTSFVPQLEGRPGMPRKWVHQGINSVQSLFNGQFRLNSNGKLYDARNLPAEPEVITPTPESEEAREELQKVFDFLQGNLSIPSGETGGSNGQVIDNDDSLQVTVVGEWKNSSASSGFIGSDYIHDLNAGQGTKSVTFAYTAAETGEHTIDLYWSALSNRASNAPVSVITPAGTTEFTVNQRLDGGQWNELTTVQLNAGDSLQVRIHNTDANGYVIADAVRITAAGEVPPDLTALYEWRAFNFENAALEDSGQELGVWGDAADPDGDGYSNLLEYALGGDPFQSAPLGLLDFSFADGVPSFRLIQRTGSDWLSIAAEYSPTLGDDWSPVQTLLTRSDARPLNRSYSEVTYTFTAGGPVPNPVFFRVNAELVE